MADEVNRPAFDAAGWIATYQERTPRCTTSVVTTLRRSSSPVRVVAFSAGPVVDNTRTDAAIGWFARALPALPVLVLATRVLATACREGCGIVV